MKQELPILPHNFTGRPEFVNAMHMPFHDEHLKSGKSRGKSNLVCITSAAVSIHVHMSNLAILTFAIMMLVMMQQTPARVRRRLGTRTTRQARPSTFNQHLQYNSLTPPIQLLFTKGSFHLIIKKIDISF